jgi:hypothetical protein
MKKARNLSILLLAVIMITSLICGTALAKKPKPTSCSGLTGTWHGEEPGDMKWLAIHTSDSSDPTKGEMLMNWIWINPNLIGDGNTLTPGHGVWQLNSDGMYDYTWYSYVIDSTGTPIMTIRVSGVAFFQQDPYNPTSPVDCNNMQIYYEFAVAVDEDYNPIVVRVGELGTANFLPSIFGVAHESRVPMVVTPLPQE